MGSDPKNESEQLAPNPEGSQTPEEPQTPAAEVPFFYRINIKKVIHEPGERPKVEESKKLDTMLTKLIIIYSILFMMINSIAVLALLMIKYREVVHEPALFSHSMAFSIPGLALFLGFIFLFLRRETGRGKHYVISTILSVPMFIYTGYFWAMVLNGIMDHSPPVERKVMVTEKYLAKGASEMVPDYFIKAKTWIPGGKDISIKVSGEYYKQLEEGSSYVRLSVKPGRLGHEWIESYSSAQE
ncbi:MAG: hypothetical protein OEY50_12005 [Nitrospinota bacterium]|nr:hypothetical protein [Nitrospinota bacterium]MDH5678095.1 hypothetical protein [Nitrospinota bacterium]MDH5757417.1 hypothetical protein [Nitrospinota bacterium]